MERFLTKKKPTLDEELMSHFLDVFEPRDVAMLIEVVKRYKLSIQHFQKMVDIVSTWTTDKPPEYLKANMENIGILITLISRCYSNELTRLIPIASLLKYMTLVPYHDTTDEILNGVLGCTHLLLFVSLQITLRDFPNCFSNMLHLLLTSQIDKNRSRIIVNLIKLAYRWNKYHHHFKFLTILDSLNVSELSGVDVEKLIKLLTRQQKLHPTPICVANAFVYSLAHKLSLRMLLSILKHRIYSKSNATKISELLFKSRIVDFYNGLDVKANFSVFQSLVFLFSNLSYSHIGCSLVFNILEKLLQDSAFMLNDSLIQHSHLIVALICIWKRLIKYARNRIERPHLAIILRRVHYIMKWNVRNVVLSVTRDVELDKFLKFTFHNIVELFKCVKNANIELRDTSVFGILGYVMKNYNNKELKASRVATASNRSFEIIVLHCRTADQLLEFISNSDCVYGLFLYLSVSKHSNLQFLKRFSLLATSTGIPDLINSGFFSCQADLIAVNSPNHVFEYLQKHVFSELKLHTLLGVVSKNKNNSKVISMLIVMAYDTYLAKLVIVPNCKLFLTKELNEYFSLHNEIGNQMGLLLHCAFRSFVVENVDEFIIEISHRRDFGSSYNTPEILYLDTLNIKELMHVVLFCDCYDLYEQGVTASKMLLNKMEIDDLFDILNECKEYNPHLLDLSILDYLFQRLIKIWLKNINYCRRNMIEKQNKYLEDLSQESIVEKMMELTWNQLKTDG
eukprot:NODE_210_length_14612_cov_0.470957.p2 type:complete len:737 gc:universal NODE_210_length_14612_cov_0.470957:3232-1022(-)